MKPKLANFGGQKNGFEINDFISKYEQGVKKRAFYIQKEKELQVQRQEFLKQKSKEMQSQYTKFKLKQDQKIQQFTLFSKVTPDREAADEEDIMIAESMAAHSSLKQTRECLEPPSEQTLAKLNLPLEGPSQLETESNAEN